MAQPPIDAFLADVQLRAFRIAQLAVRSEADALDLVQEAMMKLVENYSSRPASEWPPLFYRILQNGIADFFRRSGHTLALEDMPGGQEGTLGAIAEELDTPARMLAADRLGQALLEAIEQLPLRQQQCFLLRGWEGLSVEDTAQAMNLTQGSVKTHYFRAVHRLNDILEQHHD